MGAAEIEAGRERWQQRYDAATKRDADFTTVSDVEVEPVYGPPPGSDVPDFERIGWPGSTPSPAGSTPPATAGAPGRSGSSPASAAPSTPTSATR
jgi:methylmalonyl-CoA mutase N-terminal domain/subunit